MKKFLIIWVLCIFGINTVNAQYYNPYNTAVAIAETNEIYQLNNIKFDVNAISKNPINDKQKVIINVKINFFILLSP